MPLFNIKKTEKRAGTNPEAKEAAKPETGIFEKEPKKKEKEESKIISGVFAKKEEEVKPKEKILGPLPELERKVTGAYDPTKRNLKTIRIVFASLFFISLLLIGYFYAELSPEFDLLANLRGPNTAQKLNNSKAETLKFQTGINQKNYLLLNYYIQELSYLSDSYSKARTDTVDPAALSVMQNQIILAYENAQTKWQEPKAAADIPQASFDTEVRKEFQQELTKLRKEAPTPIIVSQTNDYESALKLIGNQNLNNFFNKNTSDIQSDLPRDDSKLIVLTQDAFNILQNEFSYINSIKQSRIKWAQFVNEIEKVTKSVDTLFNTGFFEELGGVKYSAYNFDATANKISLSGRAKRDDGSTFTLIANLIDALEKSPLFEDVDNRSYPKSGSEEEGYDSSFRIELTFIN